MSRNAEVILTGFADEGVSQQANKNIREQFSAYAALGLQYYSIRFVDAGNGTKNVMNLTMDEIQTIRGLQSDFGLNVSSIGSPIGKIKLADEEDGTKNRYVPFSQYVSEVERACEITHAFESKLIRGFSFYHPRGKNPKDYMNQAVDQLTAIAEICLRSDLTFGLEVEPNLVGENGWLLAEIYEKVNHPAMVLVFDAGNLVVQGYNAVEILEQFRAMLPGLGWLHVKDFRHPRPMKVGDPVNEDQLKHFVPANMGDGGHEAVFRELKKALPSIVAKLNRRGIPGFFVDLEPHVKGGGQFGGYSGPDGVGVAARALCSLLDYVGIGYHLRNFDDILADRGF
ncbi:MAG: sugar phosphate isomerase/epimerase family protein [Planctomycetia bacterium]|nr:sugar phosphate isomerase/epimerase family protein [Planctomycetia bacterium]